MNDLINIGVIIGGCSVESEISLISGSQAYLNIDNTKYNKIMFYLDKNNKLYTGKCLENIETFKTNKFTDLKEVALININNQVYYYLLTKPKKLYPVDIFIPVVHGYGVEDGTIAGYLDMYKATYTSSSLISSSTIQDKTITKTVLDKYKIDNVKYQILLSEQDEVTLELPLIIKPAYLGSSIGISIAKTKEELHDAINEAFKYSNKVLVEKYIKNFKEYNCAVIKNKDEYISSSIEEVLHTKDILSFVDKYEDNNKMSSSTNRIVPANISDELNKKIKDLSIYIYKIFNLNGVVRLDYLYDIEEDILYVNEINNIPGSLSYYLFEPLNISFTKLLDILIYNAIYEKHKKDQLITVFKSNVLNSKTLKLKK